MTVMTSWDLFEDLRDVQDEMLRMNRMRAPRLGEHGQQHDTVQYYDRTNSKPTWAPALDISERTDAYLVVADLPGVAIDDLEITFAEGLLTVQGERHVAHDSAEERMHRVERRYGTFRRSITLPTHVMADAIEASTQDGVLQILIPKAEEVHAKRIQVHVGRRRDAPIAAADDGKILT